MRSISHRELRNDNAAIIRAVEAGESFTVTKRGVPVARLIPIAADLRRVRAARPESDVLSLQKVVTSRTTSTISGAIGEPLLLETELLGGIDLYELPPPLFAEAGLLPGAMLRSLDAIHLAAAIRLEVSAVATYDTRMQDAAAELGIDVLAPA